jgi:Asp/Glu/hydantoin racemase
VPAKSTLKHRRLPRVRWILGGVMVPEREELWDLLRRYFTELARGEFEVHVHGMPYPAGGVRQAATRLISEAVGLALATELADDSELIIFNDWAMPVLQTRTMLEIPVTCVSEASVVMGGVLARRPAVVTVAEGMRAGMERDIREFAGAGALADRPVWWLDPPSTQEDVLRAVHDPEPLIARFEAVAVRAADDGADAILTGCGSYGPIFKVNGYDRLRDRPDVPVYDCAALAMELGRSLYQLNQLGLRPSERSFAAPTASLRTLAHKAMSRLTSP